MKNKEIHLSLFFYQPTKSTCFVAIMLSIVHRIIYQKYELFIYNHNKLNFNQITLGCLPMLVIDNYTIQTILNSPQSYKKRANPL